MKICNEPESILAGLVSAVIITPLCGLVFYCGCTWPWAGLASHCNIADPSASIVCPWCGNLFVGVTVMLANLWITIAVARQRAISRWLTPTYKHESTTIQSETSIWVFDSLLAISVFVILTISAATLTALLTGYPLFFH